MQNSLEISKVKKIYVFCSAICKLPDPHTLGTNFLRIFPTPSFSWNLSYFILSWQPGQLIFKNLIQGIKELRNCWRPLGPGVPTETPEKAIFREHSFLSSCRHWTEGTTEKFRVPLGSTRTQTSQVLWSLCPKLHNKEHVTEVLCRAKL